MCPSVLGAPGIFGGPSFLTNFKKEKDKIDGFMSRCLTRTWTEGSLISQLMSWDHVRLGTKNNKMLSYNLQV